MKINEELQADANNLKQALKGFDPYYDFTDDYNLWSKYEKQYQLVSNLYSILKAKYQGNEPALELLYGIYSKGTCTDNPAKEI